MEVKGEQRATSFRHHYLLEFEAFVQINWESPWLEALLAYSERSQEHEDSVSASNT
jgi:hypothetical protein